MEQIQQVLYLDPQAAVPTGRCGTCGGEFYNGERLCLRCQRRRYLTMTELSDGYRESANLLRQRIRQLRQMIRESSDPEQIWRLRRRIVELTPMLHQADELADLTAHYYDRGYWRNEKYTL